MRKLIYIAILALASSGTISAQLIVNEVMVNEPGGDERLEWIELYNDLPGSATLDFYFLKIVSGSDSVSLDLAGRIPSRSYFVLCRDFVRFEEHWGDSSGVWGDDTLAIDPVETFLISQRSIQLTNSEPGRVELYLHTSPGVIHSELSWTEDSEDGHSWERYHPDSDQILQSEGLPGGTPGRENSRIPVDVDLALAGVEATPVNDSARLVFEIVNRGLSDIQTAYLDVFEFDTTAPDSAGHLVASETVGRIDSGFTVLLVGQYQFSGVYQKLIARLRGFVDDRPANDQFAFVAPGRDYPPVLLSEIQARSPNPLGSEWVELENVCDTTVDLIGWQLGDSISYHTISGDSLPLPPGEFMVLADDTAGFRIEFPFYDGLLHQPDSWRELNNGSDSVRLLDFYGLQADRFYYDHNPDDGHTWSRSSTGEPAVWGRSEDPGGTPGEPNRIRVEPDGSNTLSIEITPQILSPDGDGIDDSTVITITASNASAYVLRIYDSHGRLIKTFEDYSPDLAQNYVWHGLNDGGRKLPIGMYILYFEASGVESIKKTIVLAR